MAGATLCWLAAYLITDLTQSWSTHPLSSANGHLLCVVSGYLEGMKNRKLSAPHSTTRTSVRRVCGCCLFIKWIQVLEDDLKRSPQRSPRPFIPSVILDDDYKILLNRDSPNGWSLSYYDRRRIPLRSSANKSFVELYWILSKSFAGVGCLLLSHWLTEIRPIWKELRSTMRNQRLEIKINYR